MSEELKPCPNPECQKSEFCFDYGDIGDGGMGDAACGAWVICQSCGMQGPGGAEGKAEAIRLWNLLPRQSDVEEWRTKLVEEGWRISEVEMAKAWDAGAEALLREFWDNNEPDLDVCLLRARKSNPHRKPVT